MILNSSEYSINSYQLHMDRTSATNLSTNMPALVPSNRARRQRIQLHVGEAITLGEFLERMGVRLIGYVDPADPVEGDLLAEPVAGIAPIHVLEVPEHVLNLLLVGGRRAASGGQENRPDRALAVRTPNVPVTHVTGFTIR